MSTYELTFIFDKQNKNLPAKLEGQLKEVKANNIKKDDWGIKHFAYPINKKTEGHYLVFTADIEPAKMKALEEKIRLDEELMRHLIVKV